jgi:hypothetical protein
MRGYAAAGQAAPRKTACAGAAQVKIGMIPFSLFGDHRKNHTAYFPRGMGAIYNFFSKTMRTTLYSADDAGSQAPPATLRSLRSHSLITRNRSTPWFDA